MSQLSCRQSLRDIQSNLESQQEKLYHLGGDNAVAESFFSSLKKEKIKKRIYKTREMARVDVFDYIEIFYNRIRHHSHLDGMSPEAFEAASK
jgi:transposase InsO family protein